MTDNKTKRLQIVDIDDGQPGAPLGDFNGDAFDPSDEDNLEMLELLGKAMAKPPSPAERMVRLLENRYELGISSEGDVFAVEKKGPRVALLLARYGSMLRATALKAFRDEYGETPSSNAARDALAMVEAETRFSGIEPTQLYMRFAHDRPDRLLVDLGDSKARVVDVRSTGWEVRLPTASDPLFVRTPRLGSFPEPVRGGDFSELREFVNLSDDEWDLYVAWTIIAMFPDHPHPVVFPEAPHGTGKTTIGNIALAHLDPGNSMGAIPRDDRSWETRLSRSYAIGIDNVSYLNDSVQDSIARAITGDEISRRRLFTDDDEIRFVLMSRMVMTSIGLPNKRGDFADRLLLLQPKEWKPDAVLLEEDQLKQRINDLLPRTFGASLDLVVDVLAALPQAKADRPSDLRLAAFGTFLHAFDLACGTSTVDTYRRARVDVTRSALESDDLWPHLAALVDDRGGFLQLSASEIRDHLLTRLRANEDLRNIVRNAESRQGNLRTATSTGSWLSRLAGSARPLGWTFSKKHSGKSLWTIASPREDACDEASNVSNVSNSAPDDPFSHAGLDTLDTLDTILQTSLPAVSKDGAS